MYGNVSSDGGVQPRSQPHSGSAKLADWKSNAHDQFPAHESPDPDGHVRQDSHTANQSNVLSSSANNSAKITHTRCQIVPWRVEQLRPHPSYARLGIRVPASSSGRRPAAGHFIRMNNVNRSRRSLPAAIFGIICFLPQAVIRRPVHAFRRS